MNAGLKTHFLSPLPGLGRFAVTDPRLSPWATVGRRIRAFGFTALNALFNLPSFAGTESRRLVARASRHAVRETNAASSGAERRQKVAHAARHGYQVTKTSSPGEAEDSVEIFPAFMRCVSIERMFSIAPSGLDWFYSRDPRLSPRANLCRHDVASK